MSNTSLARSVVTRLAGIAVVVLSAAGCPSSSDEQTRPDAASPAAVEPHPSQNPGNGGTAPSVGVIAEPSVEPTFELPRASTVEPAPAYAAPAVLADEPRARPIATPRSPTAEGPVEKGPIRPAAEYPGTDSNPLRHGDVPAAEGPSAAKPRERPGKHSDEPYDPIKENGPIFVGWPKPKLALVITGRQEGYLEPCGCAGLDRMKGGMSRRHTLLEYLRANEGSPVAGPLRGKGWPVVGIDVGGLAKGYGHQANLKFRILVESVRKMGYQAIGLGKTDLRLPAGELLSADSEETRFVSANVALFGFDAELTARSRIVEAGGIKLGITSVLGSKFQKEILNNEIEMADPETALKAVVAGLKKEADYLILLAHATKEESIELARTFGELDLVVTAGGAPTPPAEPEPIEGSRALLIEVGEKGMDAIVLGLFDDPQRPWRYQRVPLDSRFPASREMRELMVAYQDQLQVEGFEKLVMRPVPHPQKAVNGKFVGSKECGSCHEASYDVWKKSRHAAAYQTLVELDPPRQFDPECVSCHVIGWHPTKYFPYETGYWSLEKTPELIDVGCESCHGPGGAHVAAEMGSDVALQERLRKALVITKAESADPRSGKQHCYSCHDLDNSPDFDFETYWPYVEHYEE